MLEYVKSLDAKRSKCHLNIYVQLFPLNCIEKDLYIAIKVKLLERFNVILSIIQK